jgi:hypothetical protein
MIVVGPSTAAEPDFELRRDCQQRGDGEIEPLGCSRTDGNRTPGTRMS